MDELHDKLFEMFEQTQTLAAAYDGSDRLRYANQAFRSAFFLNETDSPVWSDLMRANFHARRGIVITAPDFESWLLSTQSRRGKIGFRAFETNLVDGRWLWMTETVQGDGWMLCIASDVTMLRAQGRSIRQDRDSAIKAAYTDELTGIANRRFVTARMQELAAGSRSPDGVVPGCVCVLDLDNFKYINDRYGHQAGDTILRDFAVRIQHQVRRSDCFGRVGGEEFVLVLPKTSAQTAELIVARMLSAIRSSRPLKERPDFGYTFSAGIAEALAFETVEELYSRADNALYSAKMAGRNRIHRHAA